VRLFKTEKDTPCSGRKTDRNIRHQKERISMKNKTIFHIYALATIVALSVATTVKTAHAQDYVPVVLGPGEGHFISKGIQVGRTNTGYVYWQGTPISKTNIPTPPGVGNLILRDFANGTVVGVDISPIDQPSYAISLSGAYTKTGPGLPPYFFDTGNYGIANDGAIVGRLNTYHAAIAVSPFTDIHPSQLGMPYSYALGIDKENSSHIVGQGLTSLVNGQGVSHAFYWSSQNASSAVDLHPNGYSSSWAKAISGNIQVGSAIPSSITNTHAMLWTGTAASAVDLNPTGFSSSFASGVRASTILGNAQIGTGTLTSTNKRHALLWRDTVASVVDLHNTLTGLTYNGTPLTFAESTASQIDTDGTIVGTGTDNVGNTYALYWTNAFTLTSLSPSQALQNTNNIAVTLTGANFGPNDIVQFNGNTIPSTRISLTQLRVNLPRNITGNFPIRVVRGSATTSTLNFSVYTPTTANCTSATYSVTGLLPQRQRRIQATLANTGQLSASNLTNLVGKLYTPRGVLVATLGGVSSSTKIPEQGSVVVTYNIPNNLSLPSGSYNFIPTGSFTTSFGTGFVTGSATVTVP
jgi:hypothetical protein